VNLFEHEMAIAALARRHGVPGDFFEGSLNRFPFAVKKPK
jgi:hypothetical protein